MEMTAWFVYLTGAYPLWQSWRANRRTSLFQAINWTIAAWVAWGGMMAADLSAGGTPGHPAASYVALCLTGCAGVAVLGARRPGVGAWNFVLIGLVAVMFLPLAEKFLIQGPALGPLQIFFLAATGTVGIGNYLPTRLAPAALLVGLAFALQILTLTEKLVPNPALSWWLLALAPWVGFARWRLRPPPLSEFDQIWLDFRDRFGFLWGQRMREQFNRAAAHAGWPVVLRWQGLRLLRGAALPEPAVQAEIVATLRALLQRFGERQPPGPAADSPEPSQ
jgi:hypothetical protein